MSLESIKRRRPDLIAGGLAALIAFVAAMVTMRIWHADLAIPLVYKRDSLYVLAITKQALSHPWYLNVDTLGAPFGAHLQDFPVFAGDPIQIVALKFLGLFTSYPVAYNLYYLLGFPLTAISAFVVLRVFDVSRATACVMAALFAILPFHFDVGASRPFEAGYWVIPICCYLLLAVAGGRELFTRADQPRNKWLVYATSRTGWTVLLCVVAASAGIVYFSLYAAILMPIAAALAAIRVRKLRALAPGLVVTGLIVGMLGVNSLPTIVFEIEHGNVAGKVDYHRARDTEQYSLSLTQLLMPIPGNRISPLAELRDDYRNDSAVPTVADQHGLGPVAGFGLLFLLGLALTGAVGAVRRTGGWARQLDSASLTLAALLIATIGGFSMVIAELVTPQFRNWDRYHVFIAFFSLLAVGFLLDLALRRFGRGRRSLLVTGGLLGAVLVIGVLEQTSRQYIPRYALTAREWNSDKGIVDKIEKRLPAQAQVFQLPYVAWPGWGPSGARNRAVNFDGFRPFLHSNDLRFSFGSTVTRPEDWQAALMGKPVSLVLPSLAAAGFDGILIYRYAYDNFGRPLVRDLRRQLGTPPIVSHNRRFAFFDLRAYRNQLLSSHTPEQIERLRTATLYPLRITPGSGTEQQLQDVQYAPTYRVDQSDSELTAENPSGGPESVRFRLSVSAAPTAKLSVRLPDGQSGIATRKRPLEATVSFPPGTSKIAIRTSPLDLARGDVFVTIEAIDSSLTPFAVPSGGRPASPATGGTQRSESQPSPTILSSP